MEEAGSAAKRVVLETVGWILLLAGLAAIFLPGPGLLMIFAGLAVLSRQYAWADRRVEPVRLRAMKAAAEGVQTRTRIFLSVSGAVLLGAASVLWILQPPAPSWWPVSEAFWLPGGLATAITQIVSAVIALALIVYSYRRFYGDPDALSELEQQIQNADKQSQADHRTVDR
jgi:hypothetical protein